MNRFQLARVAGLICLAGGVLQIIYGLIAIPFPPYAADSTTLGWAEGLWALVTVGMLGGVVGLLALDMARPRGLARIGAILAIVGLLIRFGAATWDFVSPTTATISFILLSIFLFLVGMGILGVTTLLGKQLSGWQAWTPLFAGAFALIPTAIYSLNQYLHFILLGLWGLPWLLVGYVVFTQAAKQGQARRIAASGALARV